MKLHPLKSISELPLPLAIGRIPAGFPSPAEQYTQDSLDLNELVVRHPSATFYAWAEGSSMELAGIYDGDLLVIDRSLEPVSAGCGALLCECIGTSIAHRENTSTATKIATCPSADGNMCRTPMTQP